MISRANRRILALLGFSSAVHAGALLAYGYLYPSEPQALFATPTLQLQLLSALPPQPPLSTRELQPVNAAASPSRVLVTRSQQAAFSVVTGRVATTAMPPSTPDPVLKPLTATPIAVAAAIEQAQKVETVLKVPKVQTVQRAQRVETQQRVELLKSDADPSPDQLVEQRELPPSAKAVEAETAISEPVIERSSPASQAADNPGSDSMATAVSMSGESASAQQGSAQLASIKRQLGEQMLHALASYFRYPLKARRKGWQGEVLLTVGIGRNGKVTSVQLAKSSGYVVLDRAALKSMKQVAEIDLARLDLTLTDQPLQIEIPVAYRLLN
ncbi:MAG: TonB family protein [Motiliproteus sp.]